MSLRIDEIGFGGMKLAQDTDLFCYGIDAVLLADFSHCNSGEKVCDMCSGNGIIPFIMFAKYKPSQITGVELQKASYDLAIKSLELNPQCSGMVSFHNEDIMDYVKKDAGYAFDLVTCNPPYNEKGRAVLSPSTPSEIARHESSASLEDFFDAANRLLKPRGRLCIIHRPSRLVDIFYFSRKKGLEPKTMRMVVPKPFEAANLVLVEFVKGGGKELTVMPELVVRNNDGSFTDEINRIYCK